MASVRESWSNRRVSGALCMDVEAAFPSVAKECLAKKMRAMEIEECLVRWMLDLMADRRVRMVVDGQEGEEMEVTTGLPQGSPVSPVVFAIYMADIHQAVESRVKGARGLSFVNDITWLVEAEDVNRLVKKMAKCGRLSQLWAAGNAVRFETSKTEAILLSRRHKHWKARATATIEVGDHQVKFNREATRWLGVWLDSSLRLTQHRSKCIAKARAAEKRLRNLVGKYRVPPASARNLQVAIVQSTMLYGSELTWNGKEPQAKDYQLAINRMAHRTLGVFRSTPLGALIAERDMTPAVPLLNYRQSRYAQRLLSTPDGFGGAEEILTKEGSALAD
jgi:hypothetical protein